MSQKNNPVEPDYEELIERVGYVFGVNRRAFVQFLGAGLLIATSITPALAQRSGRRGGFGGSGARNLDARIHLGKDGSITVFTGKVEAGQGARAELLQAAAEELRVKPGAVTLLMADTQLVPDDGITAGSGSTPRTVPAIRQAAAAARGLLLDFAARQWQVEPGACEVRDGKAVHAASGRSLSYADLAANEEALKAFLQPIPETSLTAARDWKLMGTPLPRPNGRDLVTGKHQFPSDIRRPGMLYGKILRAPSYGAKLISIDLAPAKAMKDVVVVREEQFVGVAARTSFQAEAALNALSRTAKWEAAPHPSSKELYDHLKQHAQGGIPSNPFGEAMNSAKKTLRQTYDVAYVQHAPLEPRAAVAEWTDGQLTVWAGTQNPFGHRRELTGAFHLTDDKVRVIVPDFGAGFGGKHTGEASVEAARLAQAAHRPVSLRWTREEEFTWAYFRPAGVILAAAGLDEKGAINCWHFVNINSGGSAVETPYQIAHHRSQYIQSSPPLRHGSYRGLAATANNFARESFMDELAHAAGADPLEFRLAHLEKGRTESERLRKVLETAAAKFNWKDRARAKRPGIGIGLACGTEKGSYVAACVELEIKGSQYKVRRICEAFECGAIIDPDNLSKQVQGAILMGLGPALEEEMLFEGGKTLNASFRKYGVPRFGDVPELEIELVPREGPSAGAGETPIMAVAPAIANALFQGSGTRVRSMPIRLPQSERA